METQNRNIEIQKNIDFSLKKFLKENEYSKIGLLFDKETERHCYPLIKKWLPPHSSFCVTSGEEKKGLSSCVEIWSWLTKEEFDRHSVVLLLGGGTLGDMGGFCAATFKRGIDFVLLPTTLLAQADACIGGKLGINFDHHKNQIGLFQEPKGIFISSLFLKTLPYRELRSGFAEIIKHYLIGNRTAWDTVRKISWTDQRWEHLVAQSIHFKTQVVAEDPYEKGKRKILNFGHTVGHAVESCALKQDEEILHGEAIAIGMIAEAHISTGKNRLRQSELSCITSYLTSLFGIRPIPSTEMIIHRINQDKKRKEDKILMSLITTIGHADWDIEVSRQEIYEALQYYRSLKKKND